MKDRPNTIELFEDDTRGVSQIIAVALLILVAVGFVVGIEEVGTDFLSSVEQPPEAGIVADPSLDDIRLTVQGTDNADSLVINYNGNDISDIANLTTDAGSTTVIEYNDVTGIDGIDEVNAGDQISVIAIDEPDNEAVVFRYEITNETADNV